MSAKYAIQNCSNESQVHAGRGCVVFTQSVPVAVTRLVEFSTYRMAADWVKSRRFSSTWSNTVCMIKSGLLRLCYVGWSPCPTNILSGGCVSLTGICFLILSCSTGQNWSVNCVSEAGPVNCFVSCCRRILHRQRPSVPYRPCTQRHPSFPRLP